MKTINLALPERYKDYGYKLVKMIKLSYEAAYQFYQLNAPIYRLYPDNTEALVNNLEEMLVHCENDGIFGIEFEDLFRVVHANHIILEHMPIDVEEFIIVRKSCLTVLDQLEELRQCCADNPSSYTDEEVLKKCIEIVESAPSSVSGFETIKNGASILMNSYSLRLFLRGPSLRDHAIRHVCADFASVAGFDDRCAWTDYLKQMDSNYKRRLDNGTFHI